MIRRPLSHPTPFYRGLSVLLLLLLLVAGCGITADGTKSSTGKLDTTSSETTKVPESNPAALLSLKKAQDLFNEAVKSDQPTAVNVPAASRQKYQQVVDMVEKEVLGRVDASVNVSAYALLAFSQWRLDNFKKAMEAGEKGRRLFETAKLATNRRDYGMCLMVGGLCTASQTYKEYLQPSDLSHPRSGPKPHQPPGTGHADPRLRKRLLGTRGGYCDLRQSMATGPGGLRRAHLDLGAAERGFAARSLPLAEPGRAGIRQISRYCLSMAESHP